MRAWNKKKFYSSQTSPILSTNEAEDTYERKNFCESQILIIILSDFFKMIFKFS